MINATALLSKNAELSPKALGKECATVTRVGRIEAAIDRISAARWLVLLGFTVAYLIPTLVIASGKLFWDDEFFTLYLSTTPNWKTLLEAMATGADQHPPSFYYLVGSILKLFGATHITVRLTAIFGYWLMCVSLYEIVRRLARPIWGVVAMTLPLASGSYYYASEARGYGLLVGFSALALLLWMLATDGIRRNICIPLIALSLAGATGSHYYGVLSVIPLGAGELVRSYVRRKIDWSIWAGICGALVPLIVFVQTMRSASGYSSSFWAKPHRTAFLRFFPETAGFVPQVIVAVFALLLLFRWYLKPRQPGPTLQLPLWTMTAIATFCCIPFIGWLLAFTVTNGYVARYVLAGIIGIIIICVCGLALISGGRTLAGACSVVLALAFMVVNAASSWIHNEEVREESRHDYHFLKSKTPADAMVVISEISVFHRLSYYTPRDFASRLVYAADPTASVKYLGHDTVDRGLLELRPWFPLNVLPLQFVLGQNPKFLAYGYIGNWTWLTFELSRLGLSTRLSGRSEERLLFSVSNSTWQKGAAISEQSLNLERTMLYTKQPRTGTSLCALYMSTGQCTGFE